MLSIKNFLHDTVHQNYAQLPFLKLTWSTGNPSLSAMASYRLSRGFSHLKISQTSMML